MNSKINFFTDINAMDSQNASGAFGPMVGQLTSQYRVNSLHSASGFSMYSTENPNPRAYSICIGNVRVFENSKNANLINIVLQPTTCDFNGLKIKYFIYRGILKSSISSSNLIIEPGTYSGGTLISDAKGVNKMINDDIIGKPLDILGPVFNNSVPSIDPFYRVDSDPLSSLFFEFESNNKPRYVGSGTFLGDFDKNAFSIEIVVIGPHPEPTIGHAKSIDNGIHKFTATDHYIDVSSLSGDINGLKYAREAILNYIDPVAFYGSMLGVKGYNELTFNKYDTNSTPKGNTLNIVKYITNADYYTNILSKFANENRIYLDIRNENDFSLNFYDEYNNINYDLNYIRLLNNNQATYSSSPYSTSSWPIKIFNATDATALLTGLTNSSKQTAIRLNLGIGGETYLDGTTQRYVYAAHSGIFFKDNIKGIKRIPESFSLFSSKEKLFQVIKSINQPTNFDYDDISLSTPIIQVGSPPQKKLLSFYIKIVYNKQGTTTQNYNTTINSNSVLDNLFELNDFQKVIGWRPAGINYNTLYWLTGKEKFVHYNSTSILTENCMVEAGVAVDYLNATSDNDKRIHFFTLPFLYMGQDPNRNYLSLEDFNIMRPTSEDSFLGTFRNKLQNQDDKRLLFYKPALPVPHLKLSLNSGQNAYDMKSLISFSMSIKEYVDCKSVVLQSAFNTNYHPIYLQAKLITSPYSSNYPDLKYFNLYAVGFDNNRQALLSEMKTSIATSPLEFIGTENIFSSQRGIGIETQAIEINEFLDFLFSASSSLNQAQEQTDFKGAIDLIKRYTASTPKKKMPIDTMFQRITQYITKGKTDVVYHDSFPNYNPQTVRYQIRIVMDDSTPSTNDNVAGTTSSNPYLGAFYPGGPIQSSNSIIKFNRFVSSNAPQFPLPSVFKPQQSENSFYPTSPRNFHNYKLYFDHNINSAFLPSQYESLFYTNADRNNNTPINTKFYFEAENYKVSGNPVVSMTIEDANQLGICAIDKLITITIKKKFYTHCFNPQNPTIANETPKRFDDGGGYDPTKGINPKAYFLAVTLIHELGHAISAIENPVKDQIWGKIPGSLEDAFAYTKTLTTPHTIVETSFKGLDTAYNTLPFTDPNTFIQYCISNNFNFKYGDGHLKGNITGNASCGVDISFDKWFARTFRPYGTISGDNTYLYTTINTEYCKFNLDNP